MSFPFSQLDPWQRTVYIEENRWIGHVLTDHPEFFENVESVLATIREPDVVCFDVRRPNTESFYRLGALLRYPRLFVKVSVQFRSDNPSVGRLLTAHLTNRIKRREEVKWRN